MTKIVVIPRFDIKIEQTGNEWTASYSRYTFTAGTKDNAILGVICQMIGTQIYYKDHS